MRDTEAAVTTVGERALRPGRLLVGQTGRLTPTRAGFRALRGALDEMTRARGRGAWVMDLQVRFRGPDAKWRSKDFTGAGVPRFRDVQRFRRESNARFKKTKGKRGGVIIDGKRRAFRSDVEAFRYLAETQIRAATFRTIDHEKTVQGDTDLLMAELEGKEPEQIAEAFRLFKDRRALTFRAKLYRVVGGRVNVKKTKAKATRRRPRQRG